MTNLAVLVYRKLTPSPKSNIPKSWTRLPISPSWVGSWIPAWVPSTGISSVKLVAKECRSVRVILAILSWRDLFSILVRAFPCGISSNGLTKLLFPLRKGFIVKVKKILESICVNCGKLKADIVSRVSFLYSFRTPTTQFSGGSLHKPWRTPNPHHVLCL
jgi:hypothetical protein